MAISRTLRHLLAASSLALVALAPTTSMAEPDADATRLANVDHTLKWNWTPPGHQDRYGHAEVLVHAPLASVRAQVLDFANYKTFAPWRFKNSRIIGKEGESTDVYLQVSALKGLITLWNVTRFAPPKVVKPGHEIVEGKFVKGNVKDANVVWTMRELEEGWTVLKCDILLKPDLPAPQSALDEELRDAAQQAVDAVHNKAQGNDRHDAYTPKA
jgi:ribosome-associated toxin RatA of RatAB toxin-antitoxin module